jgi:hypothetical protein
MRLRFRHPEGTATLSNANENDSLDTLKEQLGQLINLPSGKVINCTIHCHIRHYHSRCANCPPFSIRRIPSQTI